MTTRPTSWTATIRSTRTSPSPGSTATCAIWQPNVFTTKPSGFGPREPEPSIVALPSFSVTSVTAASIAPSWERIRPSRDLEVAGGDLEHVAGELQQRSCAPSPRRERTAGITDGVVCEPPATGP